MTDTKYVYEREMEVRDYELDAEGIVNNANYLHYLEHTRHGFCVANGISFAQMQEKGVIPVLNRVKSITRRRSAAATALSASCGWSGKAPGLCFIRICSRQTRESRWCRLW